jgi:hypothetical protein
MLAAEDYQEVNRKYRLGVSYTSVSDSVRSLIDVLT